MTSKAMVSSDSDYSDDDASVKSSVQKSLAQPFHCPNCPYTSFSVKSHHRHLRSHLACYSAYECNECLVSFHVKEVYLQHREEEREKKKNAAKHKLSKSYVCPTCKRQCFSLCTFNRHLLKHNGPPYKCPICKEKFSSVSARGRHIKNHVIKCSLCDIYFQEHSDLMKHISLVHRLKDKNAEIEPIVPISPENVPSSESEPEEDSWSEKNFICFVCEQRFSSEEAMKTHMKAHKLFPCSKCPRFFPFLPYLLDHERSHQNEKICSEIKLEQKNDPPASESDVVLYQPKSLAAIQALGPDFSTENLDKSERPVLDFDNLLHFNWLMKYAQEVQTFELPLAVPASEKLSHIISLLNIQLTYSTGLVDLAKNYKYFACILKLLTSVLTEHFLELAKLKNNLKNT